MIGGSNMAIGGMATTNENISKSRQNATSAAGALWQHPYVDVFKHFKIMPTSDWKANKKQGDVSEIFVSLEYLKIAL
jgi:hypothetical protein